MYTDVTTFEIAAQKKGVDPNWVPDFSMFPEAYRKAKEAEYRLDVIIEQMNNDPSFPDFSNWSQPKYYLWLDIDRSGSGWSLLSVGYSVTSTIVGARRSFKERAAARFCFETFKELFEASYLNNK